MSRNLKINKRTFYLFTIKKLLKKRDKNEIKVILEICLTIFL